MSGLEQITAPLAEPLSLAEVKDALKVEQDEEDALLLRLITVARQRCEQYTGRVLMAQSWRLTLDEWPGRIVDLPNPPLMAVTSVTIYAADDTPTVLDASVYAVDTAVAPGRIIHRTADAWSSPGRDYNGIEIDYQAGYGASWNEVPEALRQGMLHVIAQLYEARDGTAPTLPPAVLGLWQPYRLVRL